MWNNYRNSKYGNTKTNVMGKTYHSKLEANDALWLKSLEQQGVITNLKEQVRYDFVINGKRLKHYSIIDFQFERNGKVVLFETKGYPSPVYSLKYEIIMATLPDDHIYLKNGTEKDILAI